MIDKEKIPTTSLITIIQEMSYTDKMLNNEVSKEDYENVLEKLEKGSED